MTKRLTRTALLLLPVAMGGASAALAQLAMDFPPAVGVATVPVEAGMFGWSLVVDAPVLLTGLAYWDHQADGLLESHEVGLWVRNGPLLASAVVPAGTGATLLGEFRVVSVAPLTLTPGQYVIAGHDLFRQDPVGHIDPNTQVFSMYAGTHFGAAHYEATNVFTYPDGATELLGFFGGNATLAPAPTAVPEPSTFAYFAAAGLVTLAGVSRHARRGRRSADA